jgi:hypothetical protein
MALPGSIPGPGGKIPPPKGEPPRKVPEKPPEGLLSRGYVPREKLPEVAKSLFKKSVLYGETILPKGEIEKTAHQLKDLFLKSFPGGIGQREINGVIRPLIRALRGEIPPSSSEVKNMFEQINKSLGGSSILRRNLADYLERKFFGEEGRAG